MVYYDELGGGRIGTKDRGGFKPRRQGEVAKAKWCACTSAFARSRTGGMHVFILLVRVVKLQRRKTERLCQDFYVER